MAFINPFQVMKMEIKFERSLTPKDNITPNNNIRLKVVGINPAQSKLNQKKISFPFRVASLPSNKVQSILYRCGSCYEFDGLTRRTEGRSEGTGQF